MKIVPENEDLQSTTAELTQPQYFAAMMEDYQAGKITYKKVFKYKKKPAKPGHVFYRIKYISQGKYIYNGAYQFKATAEEKYLANGKLAKYLIYHLSVELSKA